MEKIDMCMLQETHLKVSSEQKKNTAYLLTILLYVCRIQSFA